VVGVALLKWRDQGCPTITRPFKRRCSNLFDDPFILRQHVWSMELQFDISYLFFSLTLFNLSPLIFTLALQVLKAAIQFVLPLDLVIILLIIICFIYNNL
jgi:hypothetical protein